LEQEDFQTVLWAAGDTETTQENIENWLELNGDPGFQLLTGEKIAAVILFFILISTAYIIRAATAQSV
jgi:uncharacterized protein YehS (DUF1456 family)